MWARADDDASAAARDKNGGVRHLAVAAAGRPGEALRRERELLEHDPRFQAGERRADAAVHATAEGRGRVVGWLLAVEPALRLEGAGIGEIVGVGPRHGDR